MGSPFELHEPSTLRDIDAAITSLRAPHTVDGTPGPWVDRLDLRSADPAVCPFLRAVGERDELAVPIDAPDALNRCAALRQAIPQSLRQQELVCLSSGHVNCPRYLRGALVNAESRRRRPMVWPALALPRIGRPQWRRPAMTRRAPPRRAIGRPPISPAILGATLVLIAAFSASVAFVVARGGIAMSAAAVDLPSPSPTTLAVAPTPDPTPTPTLAVAPSPAPTPTPTPAPTPTPTPEPTPTPTPPATPEPTPTPTPAGDPILIRFPELRRCPSTADCYIYVVEPGNNLYSIARYYRVSYDRVLRMNPQITNPANIRAGDRLRMPTPQRP